MKTAVFFLLIFTSIWADFNSIYEENSLLEKSYKTYYAAEYLQTLDYLNILIDTMKLENPGLELNRGHTQYKIQGLLVVDDEPRPRRQLAPHLLPQAVLLERALVEVVDHVVARP